MVKSKTLLKEMFRSIKKDMKKYISIILVVVLGVSFYIGMKIASPVLIDSLDYFYKINNFMDLEVISQLGISQDEINEITSKNNKIDIMEGNYRVDVVSKLKGNESVISVRSYNQKNKLNRPNLVEGNMPSSIHECVADIDIKNLGYKIGDTIVVENEYLEDQDVTISGFVTSPIFISGDKGATNLLAGKVNYYIYVLDSNFHIDYFTDASVKIKDSKKTFSIEYNKQIADIKNELIEQSKPITLKRNQALIDNYQSKIDAMESEYQSQKEQAEQALVDANNQIDYYQNQINEGYNNLQTKEQITAYLNDMKQKLDAGKAKLDEQKTKLDELKANYDKTVGTVSIDTSSLNSRKKILQSELDLQNKVISDYQSKIDDLNSEYASARPLRQKMIMNLIDSYRNIIEQKQAKVNEIQTEIDDINSQISNATVKKGYPSYIKDAENLYNSYYAEYLKQSNNYDNAKNNMYTQMENAKIQLAKNQEELDNKRVELEEEKQRTIERFDQARQDIDNLKDKMQMLKNNDWFINTRDDNSGYSQYYDDVSSVKNLSKIFPIFFYLVAALITLTSIGRMLDMERTQIGTLLAVGYKPKMIMKKYIYYSLSVAVIGTLLGTIVGSTIIPTVIYKIYSMIYILPKIKLQINLVYILISFILSLLSTVLVSYILCKEIFKEIPCKLMRPKAPKIGRRTFLEKIPFIWNRLKFTQKVTARSIFRYKKRLIMTVCGVAGCTALIISGLSLRSAISSILPTQYGDLFNANVQLLFKNSVDRNDIFNENDRISKLDIVSGTSLFRMENVSIKNEYKTYNINLIVPDNNEEFAKYVKVKNRKTNQILNLDKDGIIISEKIAKILKLNIGDDIEYKDSNGNTYKVKISNICENYVEHYMYMDKELYEKITAMTPRNNMLMVKTNKKYIISDFAKELNSNNLFASMIFSDIAKVFYKEILKNLNMIVLIIIISAGVLDFVVLYNLSIINISERRTELATLKVLGFRKKEIYSYIKNELVILIGIGIVFGIFLGYFLSNVIIKTCEIDCLMFNNKIVISDYLIAVVITLLFSYFIDLVINRYIRKIDMIESLKTVE